MDKDSFRIISNTWDEERWQSSIFIIGFNIPLAEYIMQKKGGIIIFTRSADIILRYNEA